MNHLTELCELFLNGFMQRRPTDTSQQENLLTSLTIVSLRQIMNQTRNINPGDTFIWKPAQTTNKGPIFVGKKQKYYHLVNLQYHYVTSLHLLNALNSNNWFIYICAIFPSINHNNNCTFEYNGVYIWRKEDLYRIIQHKREYTTYCWKPLCWNCFYLTSDHHHTYPNTVKLD